MDMQGEGYKLTQQATEAMARYGQNDPRTKAALEQLTDFQEEAEVKKKKAEADLAKSQYDLTQSRKKDALTVKEKELDIKKKQKELDNPEVKGTSVNVKIGDKTVAGRYIEDGTLQIKENGQWVNAPDDAIRGGTSTKPPAISSPSKQEMEMTDRFLNDDESLKDLRGDGFFNLEGNYKAYRDTVASEAKALMKKEGISYTDALGKANEELKKKVKDGEFNPDMSELESKFNSDPEMEGYELGEEVDGKRKVMKDGKQVGWYQ